MTKTNVETKPHTTCRVVKMPDGLFIEGGQFDGNGKFCVRRNTITQLVTNIHNTCVIVCESVPSTAPDRPIPDRIATCHPYDVVRAALEQDEPSVSGADSTAP